MKKYFYIDILRLLAAFAVVLLHASGAYLTQPAQASRFWLDVIAQAATRWCVPVFVIVSGVLLLNPGKEETPYIFFQKRAQRIMIPLLFWTTFTISVQMLVSRTGLTFYQMVRDIIGGEPDTVLWYLFMILGLYLFTPWLRIFTRAASNREVLSAGLLIGALVFGLAVVNLFLRPEASMPTIFDWFIPYLSYFLMGYGLSQLEVKQIRLRYMVMIFLGAVLASILLTGLMAAIKPKAIMLFLTYFSPSVAVSAASLYLVAKKLYQDVPVTLGWMKVVTVLAPATMGIYLLHPWFMEILKRTVGLCETCGPSLFYSPLTALVAFLLSSAAAFILLQIPIVRRII